MVIWLFCTFCPSSPPAPQRIAFSSGKSHCVEGGVDSKKVRMEPGLGKSWQSPMPAEALCPRQTLFWLWPQADLGPHSNCTYCLCGLECVVKPSPAPFYSPCSGDHSQKGGWKYYTCTLFQKMITIVVHGAWQAISAMECYMFKTLQWLLSLAVRLESKLR